MALLSSVLSGLAGGVAVVLLARAARRAVPDRQGWRRIKPGAMHWTGLLLGGALLALFLYVWLFVGSSRADGEHQMRILGWMIIAFAIMTGSCAVQMILISRRAVQWRGQKISFAGRDGAVHDYGLGEIRAIVSGWSGQVSLHFADGAQLRLDPYAKGASELIERIERNAG